MGAREGAIAGRPPMLFLADGIGRSTYWAVAHPKRSKMARGATGGARPGKRKADRPPDNRPGNHCAPRQTPLDNPLLWWEDRHAKSWATAGSRCGGTTQNADVERDGGRNRRPAPGR